MTISPLAMLAKKTIEAAWLHGPAYDLATIAAEALESAQMLRDPGSTAGADAAPGLSPRRSRLLDAIRTHGGAWTTSRVLELYALTEPNVTQRGTARRDLKALHQAGHLALVNDPNHRHYVLKYRKDGRR